MNLEEFVTLMRYELSASELGRQMLADGTGQSIPLNTTEDVQAAFELLFAHHHAVKKALDLLVAHIHGIEVALGIDDES